MSETYQSLSHSKWDWKYHVVFVPKRRRKAIFSQRRRQPGAIFHALARQKECQIIEGQLMPVHRAEGAAVAGIVNTNRWPSRLTLPGPLGP